MPYLGSTVFFGVAILATLLSLGAWYLLAHAFAPALVARARSRWETRPGGTVLLGAVSGGFASLGVIVLAELALPGAKLAATALALSIVGVALVGLAGLADRVGRGLEGARMPSSATTILRGGSVLGLSFLLPILGWFVWLPIAFYGGFGAGLLALVRRPRPHQIITHGAEVGHAP